MKITFKLLHDSLFLLIFFFILALIADGLLPGIVSERVGLYAIAITLLANALAIKQLSKIIAEEASGQIDKKTAGAFLAVLALLIFNSLIKINLLLGLPILAVIFLAAYFTYKIFSER